MADRVSFTPTSAQRIANVVRAVENARPPGSPLASRRSISQGEFRLKLGTFTGTWATGSYKTVTLTGTTQTASVYNWCTPVVGNTASTAQKAVIFGNVRGTASAIEVQRMERMDGGTRIGKVTSSWSKGSLRDVVVYENGTPGSETSSGFTLEGCVNKFSDVQADKWVAVAQAGNGSYYLIAAEC